MAISLAVARKNAACDGIVARANSGFLRIYAGSVPANADASLGAASLLGTCGFGAPSRAPRRSRSSCGLRFERRKRAAECGSG